MYAIKSGTHQTLSTSAFIASTALGSYGPTAGTKALSISSLITLARDRGRVPELHNTHQLPQFPPMETLTGTPHPGTRNPLFLVGLYWNLLTELSC